MSETTPDDKPKPSNRKAGPGVPSTFTQAAADEICERMESGETLSQICRNSSHLPTRRTVLKWRRDFPDFAAKYTMARDGLHDSWSDDIIEIADDGTNDWEERETKAGRKFLAVNYEAVARSTLRIDARKWLLSKLKPEQYGNKVDVSNKDGSLAAAFAKSFELDQEDADAERRDPATH